MLLPHLGGASIVARKLSSPADLEKEEGWPQGQAWHAEPGLDQALWMRPVAELAGYRSPIDGLWLCGPAMHPGAAAPGAAGAIVAGEVLPQGGGNHRGPIREPGGDPPPTPAQPHAAPPTALPRT